MFGCNSGHYRHLELAEISVSYNVAVFCEIAHSMGTACLARLPHMHWV